ncbi:hypothetical protein NKH18_21055 [Streptomyces sp. M10(2022)]
MENPSDEAVRDAEELLRGLRHLPLCGRPDVHVPTGLHKPSTVVDDKEYLVISFTTN